MRLVLSFVMIFMIGVLLGGLCFGYLFSNSENKVSDTKKKILLFIGSIVFNGIVFIFVNAYIL